MTVTSVNSERGIDFLELVSDNLIDVRCHRYVALHNYAEVSDVLRRFHVDIADEERTVIYLVYVLRGSVLQELCL